MLTIFLFSCNSEPKTVHLRTVKGKREAVAKVNANRLLTVEVEGMSCEMACGGSLRMNLKATGAIDRVKFDFVDGRKIQTAFISYNDTMISDREIIKLIESLNEHQFTCHKHSTEVISSTPNAPLSSGSLKVNSSLPLSAMSTLFELLHVFDEKTNIILSSRS
jgi:hypothetical protein